jgi:hypothetical protein
VAALMSRLTVAERKTLVALLGKIEQNIPAATEDLPSAAPAGLKVLRDARPQEV